MNKKHFFTIFVLVLIISIGYVWQPWVKTPVTNREGHTWVVYKNDNLSFSMEYPSDILRPQEGGSDEPNIVSFIRGQNGFEDIQVNVNNTNSPDIVSYFSQYPNFKNSKDDYTITTVAGLEAIEVKGGPPCPECRSFSFIRGGKIYNLHIEQLSYEDMEHIRQSFKIINT